MQPLKFALFGLLSFNIKAFESEPHVPKTHSLPARANLA